MRFVLLSLIGIALAFLSVAAGQDAESLVKPSTPCSIEAHRQFDFWVGEWDVLDPNGKQVGTNRIEATLGGCVLHEHWTGNGGSVGESFNVYDGTRGVWHQTWVDNQGTLLLLEGGLKDGAMVLEGETRGEQGNTLHRITWTPNDAGSVRQHWEMSQDAGESWKTAFDGKYVRQDQDDH